MKLRTLRICTSKLARPCRVIVFYHMSLTSLYIHVLTTNRTQFPPRWYMLLTHYVLNLIFILTHRSDDLNEEGMAAC